MGVLILLGVRDIMRGSVAPRTQPAPSASAPQVDQAAEAFATRFATAYLTYDSAGPDDYRNAVSPYLADGLSPNVLWNGQGHESVSMALPVAYLPKGPVVIVAVQIDGHRWQYVAVPLIHDGNTYAVAAKPALVPPPARDRRPQRPSYPEEDAALEQQLQANLSAFFQAYSGGGQTQLSYFTAPGANLTGLQGIRFDSLQGLRVFAGDQRQRMALADVRWKDSASGGSLTQTYALTLDQINGKWLVASIAPAEGH